MGAQVGHWRRNRGLLTQRYLMPGKTILQLNEQSRESERTTYGRDGSAGALSGLAQGGKALHPTEAYSGEKVEKHNLKVNVEQFNTTRIGRTGLER